MKTICELLVNIQHSSLNVPEYTRKTGHPVVVCGGNDFYSIIFQFKNGQYIQSWAPELKSRTAEFVDAQCVDKRKNSRLSSV